MSRDLNDLNPDFRAIVDDVLIACEKSGYIMRPFFTLRDVFDQARLWRQSRSTEEIENKIAVLNAAKAPFLAHVIESVGPQFGRHVTNAAPGESWHQFGEAVDCFWLVDGRAEWVAPTGYRFYATQAAGRGLNAGFFWSKPDMPHLQFQGASSPVRFMTYAEIDAEMLKRFGEAEV